MGGRSTAASFFMLFLPILLLSVLLSGVLADAQGAGGALTPSPASSEPVRVAILDSDVEPDYVAGVLYNYWELVYEWLSAEPMLDVVVITNYLIAWGYLDYYDIDVLVLIDNVPHMDVNDEVRSWWEGGGAIVALDSSIEFLCYAGILPAVSEGSNGNGVYWGYETSESTVVGAEHPITDGYSAGEELLVRYTGCAGYYESAMDDQPEWAHITVVGHDKNDGNLMTITAYEPPDKGRVAHIWYNIYELSWADIKYDAPSLPRLLRNAVKWAAGLTGQLTVQAWVDNARPTRGDNVRAYVRVSDYAGRPVEDATVSIIVGTTSLSATHQADGLYIVDINTSGMSGSVSATVRVEKTGFETKEVPLTFYVEVPPPAPEEPSLMERLLGDPLGLLALAGSVLGLLGLLVGGIALLKK